MKTLLIIFSLCLSSLMFAADPAKSTEGLDMNAALRTELSPNEVLNLAEGYVVKKGIDPKEYQNRDISLRLRGGKLQWLVFFRPSRKETLVALGDHFTIYVDDSSKKIEFMGGL